MSTIADTSTTRGSSFRAARWLRLDALFSGASGALVLAGAPLLDEPLGAPAAFLAPLGGFLLAYAGGLLLLARAGAPPRGVIAVVVGNALWAVASVVVVLTDVLSLTGLGAVVALGQAAAVAAVAAAQYASVR